MHNLNLNAGQNCFWGIFQDKTDMAFPNSKAVTIKEASRMYKILGLATQIRILRQKAKSWPKKTNMEKWSLALPRYGWQMNETVTVSAFLTILSFYLEQVKRQSL